jgi:hypothetical protein
MEENFMKKPLIYVLCSVMFFTFTACEEESSDPPEFTNGLLVTLAQNPENNPSSLTSQKEYAARRYVKCAVTSFNVATFSAKTASDEEWIVKFLWNPEDQDSVFYISDSGYNEIRLNSAETGNYAINASNDNASMTFIKVLKMTRDEIIEAKFEGYIYKTGGSSVPDTLKNGYLITKNFSEK